MGWLEGFTCSLVAWISDYVLNSLTMIKEGRSWDPKFFCLAMLFTYLQVIFMNIASIQCF